MKYQAIASFLLFSLLFAFAPTLPAQEPLSWKALADVTFEKSYDAEAGMEGLKATFGEGPRAYEDKEVAIKGFIIPGQITKGIYFLSQYPNYTCFFCGGAGPETIIELRTRPDRSGRRPHFAMDDELTFRGILRLNADDFRYTSYILEEAEVVEK
jgi:hypothetical protein